MPAPVEALVEAVGWGVAAGLEGDLRWRGEVLSLSPGDEQLLRDLRAADWGRASDWTEAGHEASGPVREQCSRLP